MYKRQNLYKDLPPLERRPDGSLYRMNPAQRKQANALIRRECCNCENGNCIALDDGDAHACPQMISFSVCCKWFRWAVLPLDGTLKAEIFRDKDLKDVYKRQLPIPRAMTILFPTAASSPWQTVSV